MAALDSLVASLAVSFNVKGLKAITGVASIGVPITGGKTFGYGTAVGNAVSLGADQAVIALVTATANTTTDIDLTALTDVTGKTLSLSGGHIKAFIFWLLGASETSPNGTAGSACSSISFGPAASNGCLLNFVDASDKKTLYNKDVEGAMSARTTGFCAVDATHKLVTLTNNDALVDGKLLVVLIPTTT